MSKTTELITPATEVWLLEWITADPALQIREGLNDDKVSEYAEHYRENGIDAMKPVNVVRLKDQHQDGDWKGRPIGLLTDGWHRLAAAERAGLNEIRVQVIDGDRNMAVMFASYANRDHGIQRSNADKRRAVQLYLTLPDTAEESSREIARRLAVSHTLVDLIRDEMARDPVVAGVAIPEFPPAIQTKADRLRFVVLTFLASKPNDAHTSVADIEAGTGQTGIKASLRGMAKAELIDEAGLFSHHWAITEAGRDWLNQANDQPVSAEEADPDDAGREALPAQKMEPLGHTPAAPAKRTELVEHSSWPVASKTSLIAIAGAALDSRGELTTYGLKVEIENRCVEQETRLPDNWELIIAGQNTPYGVITVRVDGSWLLVDEDDDKDDTIEIRKRMREILAEDLPQPLPLTHAQVLALIMAGGISPDEEFDDEPVKLADRLVQPIHVLTAALHARMRKMLESDLMSANSLFDGRIWPDLPELCALLKLDYASIKARATSDVAHA